MKRHAREHAERREMHGEHRTRNEREHRGEHRHHDGRDPFSERLERERRGGGSYDAGPGREGLPDSEEMDRPRSRWASGAYARAGDSRSGYDGEQREIQDAEGHWRRHK